MAFSFFGKKKGEPTPAPVEGNDDAPDDAVDEDGIPEDLGSTQDVYAEWMSRAAAVIPGGTSTGSKRPAGLYGAGAYDTLAAGHYVRAAGCLLVTPMDETLIDCTMALGSVSIGYGDDRVSRAVIAAIANGNVGGLPHTSEVEIAERLCEVIPCAKRVRFLKSGAEAVSAAVRIARTATGRDHVICSGYFGWHDWSTDAAGVPAASRVSVTPVPFDDVPALEAAARAAGRSLAAIVLEPVVERLPSDAWIRRARSLCDDVGAVLIVDEMKTGFRLALGGYHGLTGIHPDLAVFGKAMANGFPVAAVVGAQGVMDAAERTWISSTAAGESSALAAVGAVLDRYTAEDDDVCATLARLGAHIRQSFEHAVEASGITGVTTAGCDPMWLARFERPEVESAFLREASRRGVLFKRGAYNYAALAHDEEEILLEIERVASSAFVALMDDEGQA
jgi:glutamate-1-semialdehyde 2,1-aminomutase